MKDNLKRLSDCILANRNLIAPIQRDLCGFAAIGPENGGNGEVEKAAWIESWLANSGFLVRHLDAADPRVTCGFRPNLVAVREGRHKCKLWLFAHMDVVPAGDLSSWNTDPWKVKIDGDLLYGRGVEDNQQAIASMLTLARALQESNATTDYGLGLVFMADEENGSNFGLKWVLETDAGLFSKNDLFIVPDGGSPDGLLIEVAEKAQLWLKFVVCGKQCHASTPDEGRNSFTGASLLVIELERLRTIFDQRDPLFLPPRCTFVPSMHEQNVTAVNILPGKDVFYLDCRLLPEVDPGLVLKTCEEICAKVAHDTGLEIGMEVIHSQPATQISPEAPEVSRLARAIMEVYNGKAVPVGIGGATVAAMLRERGIAALVWSCIRNTCHQPNECSSIEATYKDALVFGRLLFKDQDH